MTENKRAWTLALCLVSRTVRVSTKCVDTRAISQGSVQSICGNSMAVNKQVHPSIVKKLDGRWPRPEIYYPNSRCKCWKWPAWESSKRRPTAPERSPRRPWPCSATGRTSAINFAYVSTVFTFFWGFCRSRDYKSLTLCSVLRISGTPPLSEQETGACPAKVEQKRRDLC